MPKSNTKNTQDRGTVTTIRARTRETMIHRTRLIRITTMVMMTSTMEEEANLTAEDLLAPNPNV